MENVTREFENVSDGYEVYYNDNTMGYEILNVNDGFYEFYTDDYFEVHQFFDERNRTF